MEVPTLQEALCLAGHSLLSESGLAAARLLAARGNCARHIELCSLGQWYSGQLSCRLDLAKDEPPLKKLKGSLDDLRQDESIFDL